MPNFNFGGRSYKTTLLPNGLYVPDQNRAQAEPWMPLIEGLLPLSDNPWLVSSVLDSMNGDDRGGSHAEGAIDLAPFLTLDKPFRPDGKSPRLYNNRMFGAALVARHQRIRSVLAVVMEDDHLHIDIIHRPGVYIYPYARYSGDAFVNGIEWSTNNSRVLSVVDINGNITPVDRSVDRRSESEIRSLRRRYSLPSRIR